MEDPVLLIPRELGPSLGTGPRSRILARAAAVAAAGCALVHLPPLAVPDPAGSGTAVLAVACLACAVHLWRRGSTAGWLLHVALTAAMFVHATGGHAGHSHAGATATWTGPVAGTLALLALGLAAVRGCWVPGPAALPQSWGASAADGPGRRVPQA